MNSRDTFLYGALTGVASYIALRRIFKLLSKRVFKRGKHSNKHNRREALAKEISDLVTKNLEVMKGPEYHKESLDDDNTQIKTPLSILHKKSNKKRTLFKIVITGGPCAGKTTGLAFCAENLEERGFKNVFIVPEAATLLQQSGGQIDMGSFSKSQIMKFQSILINLQMSLEDSISQLALIHPSTEPAVLLCDRGTMDGSAYMDPELWQTMLDDLGLSTLTLRENRYDSVIHMVTAADGAEKYYSLENNKNTLDIARFVDQNLQRAWLGHPSFVAIDNRNADFKEKLNIMLKNVLKTLGKPTTVKFFKKFLLKNPETNPNFFPLPEFIKPDIIYEDQIFLNPDETYRKRYLVKRGRDDGSSYVLVEEKADGVQIRRRVSPKEFMRMKEKRIEGHKHLPCKKICFLYKSEHYKIKTYIFKNPFSYLMIERENNSKSATIPDFIEEKILREITDEPEYNPFEISKESWTVPSEDFQLLANYPNENVY